MSPNPNPGNFFSWQWQLKNRITSAEELIALNPDLGQHPLVKAFRQIQDKIPTGDPQNLPLKMAISPYYAGLIDSKNDRCPILLQSLPSPNELNDSVYQQGDPLAEESHMPIAGLTHRYPDRVLWYTTHSCAVYCRFCMRKRKVSHADPKQNIQNANAVLEYIQKTPQIKEVILSGGDPLTHSNDQLDFILKNLKNITHLKSIRIHTRVPVTLPMRITDELCQILAAHYPISIVTHFNHPCELTEAAYDCIRALRFSGVQVLNQSVLLRGINDSVEVLEALLLKLLEFGIIPYYLHRCDEIYGNSHFQVPIQEALTLLARIRGNNPGIAIPRYMIDLPGGGGKVPLEVDYRAPDILDELKDGIRTAHYFNNEQKIYKITEPLP